MHSEESDDYDPSAEIKKTKSNNLKLSSLRIKSRSQSRTRSSTGSSAIYSDEDDVPISARRYNRNVNKKRMRSVHSSHSASPKTKRQRFSSKHNRIGQSQSLYSRNRSDTSSHFDNMMSSMIKQDKKGRLVAPSGDVVPTSNISYSAQQRLRKSSSGSKLNKMRTNHKKAIMAGNILASQQNVNQHRKSDRCKSGAIKKRRGGAVILPPGAIRNRAKQKIKPNITGLRIEKNVKKNNVVQQKVKQKYPVQRNRYNQSENNSLFKQQHKTKHQHSNTNNNKPFRKYRRPQSSPRDSEQNLFSKILKWTPNGVESALNETKNDLVPLGDTYQNSTEYKTIFEPFLLEEVRAQIAQRIEEKKVFSLIERQRNDCANNKRNKNQKNGRHGTNEIFYDIATICNNQPQANGKIASVQLKSINHFSQFYKTYHKNDLVLLVQNDQLTARNASKKFKIRDILSQAVLGSIDDSRNNQQISVYINSEHLSYRNTGSYAAIIWLENMITACREYRCLSTFSENIWAEQICQPKGIHPVDGMTLLDIRNKQLPSWMRVKLNDAQLKAISAVLSRDNNITLIKGPPGTGKTTTIKHLLNAALLNVGFIQRQRPKILVCAPSNAAIDVVIARSYQHMLAGDGKTKLNIQMVRMGRGATTKLAESVSLDRLLDPRHALGKLEKELRKLEKEQKEIDNKWRKCPDSDPINKKKYGENLRNIRNRKVQLQDKINKELQFQASQQNNHRNKNKEKANFLKQSDVIFCTLSAASNSFLQGMHFDLLVVDESTQACEISTIIPFQLDIGSIVLVGDEKQLPATVISQNCQTYGFASSLFQRFVSVGVEPYLLNIQYRMHPDIRHWPSATFYENKLKDGPNIQTDVVSFVNKLGHMRDPRLSPYVFFDVYRGKEKQTNNKSFVNLAEEDFILRLLDYMSCHFYGRCSDRERSKKWVGNVGIVTPYRGQRELFLRDLGKHKNELLRSVFVDTVESFQGQERDIIIFSCVRSQREAATDIKKANLGFLVDTRRLNVALTRAKLCCVIVGNSSTLKANKIWQQLISDAHHRGRIYAVDNPDHGVWLHRPSAAFISTWDRDKNKRAAATGNSNSGCNEQKSQRDDTQQKVTPMDVDDESRSNHSNASTSSSSHRSNNKRSRSKSRSNSVDRPKRQNNHQHYQNQDRNSRHHGSNNNRSMHPNDIDHRKNRRGKGRHQKPTDPRLRPKRKTDAEIANILNLPEPPTDPRKRRR